jgi:exopolysaccharide biosynthesis polyprenyl glycosylphosphotransferase
VQTIDPGSAVEITEDEPRFTAVRSAEFRAPAARADWRGRYARSLYVIDYAVGLVAASSALLLRFGSYGAQPFLWDYLLLTLLFPLAWMAVLAINRAYEARHLFVGTDEYARVVRSGLGLTAALAVFSFALDLRLARGYVIIALPMATALAVLARFLFRQLLHRSWATGRRLHRVILVGHARAVADMNRRLHRESHHGLGIVGACVPATQTTDPVPGLPEVYGDFENVALAVSLAAADTVVVLSCPEIDGPALRRLAWQLERDEIDLIVASTLIDVAGDRTTIRPVDGLPMLHVEHPRLKGSSRVVKEAFDRVGALMLLTFSMPALVVLALLVKFGPGGQGPVIFRQERVGRDGRPFVLYKFRTMVVNAEARLQELRNLNDSDGELFKMRNDPRITPVGRWLRRLSLDELPQLMNVLKGDMSLVGPRPPLAREVASYPEDMRRRLVVKPGLTGLWQVSGRSDLSWDESIRLDLTYVENWSLVMDLAILARTVSAVVRSSGAY